MKVRVSWTEETSETAVFEVEDDFDIEDESAVEDLITNREVAVSETYAVRERSIEWGLTVGTYAEVIS